MIEDDAPQEQRPDFLFTDRFDSWRDTPVRLGRRTDLLHAIKRLARQGYSVPSQEARPLVQHRGRGPVPGLFRGPGLRLYDTSWMLLPAFVIAMVILRSSLAGFGHYAIHRAQKGATKVLVNAFDMNYVAPRSSRPTVTRCCTIRTRRAKSISRRTCSPS